MENFLTKHFGEIEYNEDRVIIFPHGLPGFPDNHKFLLIDEDDVPNNLFLWLQCLEDADVAFTLIDIYQIMPDYNPLVEPEMIEELGDLTDIPLEIYNVAVIPEDIKQIRVNLKAPVVINPAAMRGMQVIVSNEEYSIRHYIFDEIEKSNASDNGNAS
jgi:flagellar assembly factor FliW